MSYKLESLLQMKSHHVFDVSQLQKPHISQTIINFFSNLEINHEKFEAEKIFKFKCLFQKKINIFYKNVVFPEY